MRFLRFISAIILLSLAACEADSPEPDNVLKLRELTYEEETLLNSSNEFSYDLLRMLNQKEPGENVIFSSFGIGNGIGMAFNIIQERPKKELKDFLKISEVRDIEIHKAYFQLGEILNLIDRDIRFTRANSLWINQTETINPLASDKIMAYYDADVDYIDFSNEKSIKTINRWVENRSFGKIPEVIGKMNASDKSYIINAIHFDVQWNIPFRKISMDDFKFTTLNGDAVSCHLMNLYSGEYAVVANERITLIDIPIGKEQFYLTLIVPENINDFTPTIESLNSRIVEKLLARSSKITNEVLLPAIHIDSEVRLKSLFPQLGLSGPIGVIDHFYSMPNLFISDFIHKTSFSIDDPYKPEIESPEPGRFHFSSANPLIIDRPFIFLVREKFTGAVIFTGKMVKPEL